MARKRISRRTVRRRCGGRRRVHHRAAARAGARVSGAQRQTQHRLHRLRRKRSQRHRRRRLREHLRPVRRGLEDGARRVPELPPGQALPRLPRDARQGRKEHRRRDGVDSRPLARRGRAPGDEARQARLHPEAAGPHVGRGARAGAGGPRVEGRDPDGEPGSHARRNPPDPRVGRGRRDRDRAGGPLLDQPSVVAAGHRASARGVLRAGIARLEPVARPRAGAAVQSRLCPVQVARVVGFRHGVPGRHGLPHHGRRLLDARSRLPDARRAGIHAALHGDVRRRRRASPTSSPPRARVPSCRWCGRTGPCIRRAPPRWRTTRSGRPTTAAASCGSARAASWSRGPTPTIRGCSTRRRWPRSPPIRWRRSIPRSQGVYAEWIAACKGGPRAGSAFDTYSGPFTEMVLLGCLAVRLGRTLEIDTATGAVKNVPCRRSTSNRATAPGWSL